MGSEARSLLMDEAVSLGRVVMVEILGDDSRNSFRGTAFHGLDHPGMKKHRFADRPADFIPYAYVQVIREAVGTDKMEGKVFDGPIWIQVQQVIRYFEDNFHASYNIRDQRNNATHVVDNWPPIMFARDDRRHEHKDGVQGPQISE